MNGPTNIDTQRGLYEDRSTFSHTMIGDKRLSSLRKMCEQVIQNNIPGDFIETGVWRGGACILMRAVLKAHDDTKRIVWCADSFEGLPKPNLKKYPKDSGIAGELHKFEYLSVSLEKVESHFSKYGLLDNQVRFLKGWFKDTLPQAPIEKLAILRLDGDMYESTIQALDALYDKLSTGGFLIVDDFGVIIECHKAIYDFRQAHSITDEIQIIDSSGIYWKKSG